MESFAVPLAMTDFLPDVRVFATNGAIFAYASPLPARRLRNLSATYGAAYTSYAKNASNGNLTGVNPASHPSSYVTAQSIPLGDVGSIVFELDDLVSVVTRIADRVLLATVGPAKLGRTANGTTGAATDDAQPPRDGQTQVPEEGEARAPTEPTTNGSTTPSESPSNEAPPHASQHDPAAALETQYQIDRSADLSRLAGLNLSASPAILLALESKSAALGRFLSQKLEDLECPEDF